MNSTPKKPPRRMPPKSMPPWPVLRAKSNNPELAERVANQMVEVNPKDAAAYVARGRLLRSMGRHRWRSGRRSKSLSTEAGRYRRTAPHHRCRSPGKKYDKAREYMAAAKKLHPKEPRIYQRAASLEMQQGKSTRPWPSSMPAQSSRRHRRDEYSVRQGPFADRVERLEGLAKQSKTCSRIASLCRKSAIISTPSFLVAEKSGTRQSKHSANCARGWQPFGKEMATEIDFDLALCYERLGRFEQAQQYYDLIVQQNPQNAPAVAGVDAWRGQRSRIRTRRQATGRRPAASQIAADAQAAKGEARLVRNRSRRLIELAEKNKLTPVVVALSKLKSP